MFQPATRLSATRLSATRLSAVTIALHWIVGLAIIGMLAFGLYLEDLPSGPDKLALLNLHKSIGVVILAIASARLLWRLGEGFPAPAGDAPRWQDTAGRVVHWLLLAGTVLMPLSGVLMSVGGGHPMPLFGVELVGASDSKVEWLSSIGHVVHGLGANLMIAAIVLHVAAAAKHHLVDRDATLRRMLGV